MSWFSRLFQNKHPREHHDFTAIACDMHSHLIPGIDDGAATMKDSVELVLGLKKLGYKKLVTTPHVMSDYYRNTPEAILGGLEKLKTELQARKIDMELEAAAEYYVDFEFQKQIEREEILTFGKKYILIELPFMQVPENFHEVVFRLVSSGYKPILAHPERYPFYYEDMDEFARLKDRGLLLQVNINSLTGHYSPQARKVAQTMLERGWVDFLGTDCHHIRHLSLLEEALNNPHLQQTLSSTRLLNASLA